MTTRLGLRAGDWVEVRPAREILATLDEERTLDALPFMPEMLRFCGRRFRVSKRADKTCDTIGRPISLRMLDAVHLEDLRCDGADHGGCQARCLIFWKEAWLRRSPPPVDADGAAEPGRVDPELRAHVGSGAHAPPDPTDGEPRYRCQATELQRATTPMDWWDLDQYWRELRSGNVSIVTFVRTVARAAFNYVQRRRGGMPRPCVVPASDGPTPTARLDLRPGELVRVRSKEAIEATLDAQQKNRGLYFDVEMLPYCGRTVRVLDRVERFVDEKTGRMTHIGSDCLVLENVTCGGCLSHDRLFCPRAIYSYWREIWLERVEAPAATEQTS